MVAKKDALPGWSVRRLIVPRSNVVILKAILEAYDGLASLTVQKGGVCDIYVHDSQQHSLDALVKAYQKEYQ